MCRDAHGEGGEKELVSEAPGCLGLSGLSEGEGVGFRGSWMFAGGVREEEWGWKGCMC